ncbi:MAG: hypothetical protein HY846_09225 [Nitrosomonadales bacterium]|nr:hypothetical protein [Nitrosomonadales bacterium]
MKLLFFVIGMLISPLASAAPPSPVIPLNQNLAVVEYARNGEQTGCGLRATGETGDSLWIDVLLSVFTRESGELFGMFKVVIRKINLLNGVPLLRNGQITYSSAGKIHKAWIKTGSGVQPLIYQDRESPHNDGYMATLEFDNAMELLVAISQADFRVMYSMSASGPEEVLEFNKRIIASEAGKLYACMNKLRETRSSRSDKIL